MANIIVKRFPSSNQIKVYFEGDEDHAIYSDRGKIQAVFDLVSRQGREHGISIDNIWYQRKPKPA